MQHDFTLTSDYIALNDLLKLTGLCASGGEAKMLIADHYVSVNDQIETRKTYKVRAGDVVVLGDERIVVSGA
ncbi:RNA-binding S4 domain-containing protein [Pigmentiphaga aceris]|uniref:RNA-binding S4 domain-containing protein n=1 Tax=Pigmentiphaga aceris TaxID=1940612 RepID=A0A5C0ATD0_9BURK|nr:RNA-binding S4 domain-containing protein [Pigmentiphaga aceris]QEI05602.1 RNA-binding S4 domain-containing protein [Pigmentiphaga aceris]